MAGFDVPLANTPNHFIGLMAVRSAHPDQDPPRPWKRHTSVQGGSEVEVQVMSRGATLSAPQISSVCNQGYHRLFPLKPINVSFQLCKCIMSVMIFSPAQDLENVLGHKP